MVARKLKSRRGTSLIIALLVFLICVTAGTAALTAAGANAGRYTHMRRDQQRYLAVSSAVKLVRSELADQSFTDTATLDETVDQETLVHKFQLKSEDGYSYTGAFSDWLLDDLRRCFKAQEIPAEWWSQAGNGGWEDFTGKTYEGLGIDATGDEPLLNQVKWEMTLAEDYTITARFWLEDEGKTYYSTVLTLPAQRQEETTTEQVGAGQHWVTTKTVLVTWSAADATITQG